MKKKCLSDGELEIIKHRLNREPTEIEEAIFCALWSEHCSYKSSKIHLRKLPTKSEKVVIGPGENAGVIDIGDGYVAVFKMESHNHPSFIDPYNGAATGVGGILRDIFTMGARPIMNLDALFFGDASHPKTKYLVDGVVRGVGDYGNCVGVPTVGGQAFFLSCYNNNNLVNAFTLGIAKKDKIFLGIAKTIGADCLYVGSKTGRDGIHGATMASASFDEEALEDRPSVQIGDPFTEKLLIEACLEAMDKDLIEGIQDMGAAGLTSSVFEMAQRGGVGIEIHLDKIPLREKLSPVEIMLSESQERMLVIAKPGCSAKIMEIFKKWSLDAMVIGRVIKETKVCLYFENKLIGEFDLDKIEAPIFDRPYKKPDYIEKINKNIKSSLLMSYNDALLTLLSKPNLSDKSLLYEQYDSTVQTNTIKGPGYDAACCILKENQTVIFASTTCNPIYCYLDPYKGSQIAVAEGYRNCVVSGGEPIAVTDCLNFGNPEKEEIMWQFVESINGIREACETLKTPVVSGNVSLYNETNYENIFPTPNIALVGVGKLDEVLTNYFQAAQNTIILLNDIELNLGGSQYLYYLHNKIDGKVPDVRLKEHLALKKFFDVAHRKKRLIRSAHDVSLGGLAVCLARMCENGIGADININLGNAVSEYLFSESQANVVIEIKNQDLGFIEEIANICDVKIFKLGFTINEPILKVNDYLEIPIEKIIGVRSKFFKEIFQ